MAAFSAGLLAAGSSFAQADPQVQITVTPVPELVTYSRNSSPPLTTYAAYQVDIVNNTTNDLNRVRFNANLSGDTSAAPIAVSATLNTVDCGTPTAVQVLCTVGSNGSLAPRGGAARFFVIAQVPSLPAVPTGTLKLNWTALYAEGKSQSTGALNGDGATLGSALTTLGTVTPQRTVTFVPQGGGKVFTGHVALPTDQDLFTTQVDLPASAPLTTATLGETDSCALAGRCFDTQITIPPDLGQPVGYVPPSPPFGGELSITLRLYKSALKPGTKVTDVNVWYQHEASGAPFSVQNCADFPSLPQASTPCISERLTLTGPGVSGIMQIKIRALDNGSYKVF